MQWLFNDMPACVVSLEESSAADFPPNEDLPVSLLNIAVLKINRKGTLGGEIQLLPLL